MRRLIWKEYREKRWWLLPLALYPIGCMLTNHSYSFLGLDNTSPVFGVLISWLIALLMGLSAYAPELGGETADYLYARPAGWKRVLGAKLAVALAFFAVSAVLAALVFRIICPEPYLRFAGVAFLARGAGIAALIMFGGYLLGMCCSVALPGMLGSILTLASVSALLAAAVPLVDRFAGDLDYVISSGLLVITGVAILAAGLVVIRFGLTLSLGARVRKWAFVVLSVLVCGSAAICISAPTIEKVRPHAIVELWTFSPSGRYASRTAYYGRQTLRIYRLSDGAYAEARVQRIYSNNQGWTASDKVYAFYHNNEGSAPSPGVLRLLWLDSDGKLQTRRMTISPANEIYPVISPSGRRVLLLSYTSRPGWTRSQSRRASRRVVIDLETLQALDSKLPVGTLSVWWVSDSELAYLMGKKKTVHRLVLPSP